MSPSLFFFRGKSQYNSETVTLSSWMCFWSISNINLLQKQTVSVAPGLYHRLVSRQKPSVSVPAHLMNKCTSSPNWNSSKHLSIICCWWAGPFLYQLNLTNKNWHLFRLPQLKVMHALCMWSQHRRRPCSDVSNFYASCIVNNVCTWLHVIYFSARHQVLGNLFHFLILILLCVDKCLLLFNLWFVLEKAMISQN